MNNNYNQNQRLGGLAWLGIGAGVAAGVGYAAIKLFGSSDNSQPNETSDTMYTRASGSTSNLVSNRKVIVVSKMGECQQAIQMLKSHFYECNVLAFDCEWVSDYSRHPVALLQLATHRGLCVIFRLSKLMKFPSELQELLCNEKILKVGVSPRIDAKFILDDYGVQVKSTMDLRFLAELADCRPGSLATMSENYLGVKLDKDGARFSNWEAFDLSEEQIKYASDDVFAQMELFKYFAKILEPADRQFNEKYHLRNVFEKHCCQYLDRNYNPPRSNNK